MVCSFKVYSRPRQQLLCHCPVPAENSAFTQWLPRDPLICGRLSEPFADSEIKQQEDSGLPQLGQRSWSFTLEFVSFKTVYCEVLEEMLLFFRVFFFSVSNCVWDVSVFSNLQTGKE